MKREYYELSPEEQRKMEELWDLENKFLDEKLHAENSLMAVRAKIRKMHGEE